MAGRTRPTTAEKTTDTTEEQTPDYQVPPPMEEGDARTVPSVGGDPDNPEPDPEPSDDFGDGGSDNVSISAFGVHVTNGSNIEDMEETPDGWDRNSDGSMTPNTIPWVGY